MLSYKKKNCKIQILCFIRDTLLSQNVFFFVYLKISELDHQHEFVQSLSLDKCFHIFFFQNI